MNAPWEPPTVEHSAAAPNNATGSGRRNRRTTAIGLTAGLIGGGAIGLMLGVPGLTSAATDDGSTPAAVVAQDPVDTGTDTGTDTDTGADAAAPGDRLREALQPLVDDGTITAAQADSVATYLAENRPDGGRGGQHRGGGRAFDGEVVAGLIGIDAETLRAELVAGSTIAEVATEHGVDPQTVIDALVAEAKSHLDLSVANGRLTQEEADAKLVEATERITDRVNNGGPLRGGEGRRGGAAQDAPATADTATDTGS